jgi:hypothetical protein
VKPREDELRGARSLKIWEDSAGMINLRGAFDPATGAPIKLAIEALVGAELHAARDARRGFGGAAADGAAADGAEAGSAEGAAMHAVAGSVDPLLAEQRSIAQMNADALADIARLSLSSSEAPAVLRSVTVIARVDAEALVSGRGHATIDGIEQPVSVDTARELAMSAGVAPLLMADGCEQLQLGRSRRLFSPAQRAVLIARDGGCAWPGCRRPPSHTQAHHLRWWDRDEGPTDPDNGVMLCAHHHHRVHDSGWMIRIRAGRTWFVPPVHVDSEQRPRPGNVAPGHLVREHFAARRRTRAVPARLSPGSATAEPVRSS